MVLQMRQLRDLATFTATTDVLHLTPGRYIDELILHFKGDMTVNGIVSVATMLGLVNPFEVFLKGSPVVQINAEDLYALNVLAFGFNPFTVVATAATDDQTKIFGLKVPLWQPPRASGDLTYRATRVAQTNVDTETLSVLEVSSTNPLDQLIRGGKYLSYVTKPITSAGATGFGNEVRFGTTIGECEGVLIRAATIPTNTAETSTVDNIDVYVDEVKLVSGANWQCMKGFGKTGHHDLGASPADWSILDNYIWLDFSIDPIPRGSNVRIDFDTQATSSAARFTAVFAI